MKAILKFDIPEECEEFEMAYHGCTWKTAMFDLDQYLRDELKYKNAGKDYETIREELYSILANYSLEL